MPDKAIIGCNHKELLNIERRLRGARRCPRGMCITIHIHIGVDSDVARSDRLGNLRASECGAGNRQFSTLSFYPKVSADFKGKEFKY